MVSDKFYFFLISLPLKELSTLPCTSDPLFFPPEDPQDIYWLAQCLYLTAQYHRAAHALRSRKLDKVSESKGVKNVVRLVI